MNILTYKFRPILLTATFSLGCVDSPLMYWGSCPQGAVLVNDRILFTTTSMTDPDQMWIVGYDAATDTWSTVYHETNPVGTSWGWYEPNQIFKTYHGTIEVTVGVWVGKPTSSVTEQFFIRVFHGETLVFSAEINCTSSGVWNPVSCNNWLHFSETGVINLILPYKDYSVNPYLTTYYNHRSTDGGLTWTDYTILTTELVSTEYLYITGTGDTLFAEIWISGTVDYLYKSINGGRNWTLVTTSLFPTNFTSGSEYDAHLFTFKGDLYKTYYTASNFGVQKSTDNGATFTYYPIRLDPLCRGTAVVAEEDYVYFAIFSMSEPEILYFYRSSDGENWELISSFDGNVERHGVPAYMDKDGDNIVYTNYYLSQLLVANPDDWWDVKAVLFSQDGGQTWGTIQANFVELREENIPDKSVRLTWDVTALGAEGKDIEVYRRVAFYDYYSTEWILVTTVPASKGSFLDKGTWCNIPYDYYLQVVDGAATGVVSIHGGDFNLEYQPKHVTIDDGHIYIVTMMKESYPYYPQDILILQDLVEESRLPLNQYSAVFASAGVFLQFNPDVSVVLGYPSYLEIFWKENGTWEQRTAPVLRTGYYYSQYYASINPISIAARENGEAVFVLGANKTEISEAFLDAYVTSDFGQTWTGPIEIANYLPPLGYSTYATTCKTDAAYYAWVRGRDATHNLNWTEVHTSTDGITWQNFGQFGPFACIQSDGDTAYVLKSDYLSPFYTYIMKDVGGTLQLINTITTTPAMQVGQMYVNGNHICFSAYFTAGPAHFGIMYSSDGGLNFSKVYSIAGMNFNVAIIFSGADNIVILSGIDLHQYSTDQPVYLMSEDYGVTWQEVLPEYNHPRDADPKLIDILAR